MQERSKNKQLAINMTASMLTFIVGLGIQFFLTPYIVKSLGADAYGFIGLTSNILSYVSLVTVALNSMAGRFISIKYIEGKIDEANKYFSSVFISNIILGGFILLVYIILLFFLEQLINIPLSLVFDVKLLFSLLAINSVASLIFGTWQVATFIKNRLDLSNTRSIIGNFINLALLIVLFGCFSPHIWYMGVAGLVMSIYQILTNIQFKKLLTPELVVSKYNYQFDKVIELLKSGIWNLVSRLGTMIGQGLDLLIANLFIGATAMGVFGLSRQIPFIIIGFCATMSGVFSPSFTRLYALNDVDALKREVNKSIRLLGCLVTIPLVFLFIFGGSFYQLWLPTQDSNLIHFLSILCSLELAISLPLEALWNIFMVTNKVKVSSLFMLGNHCLTFLIVITGLYLVEDENVKLVILASTRTILGIIRSLTFLPIYGAHCLQLKWNTFFLPLIKTLLVLIISCLFCYFINGLIAIEGWGTLSVCAAIVVAVCCCLNILIVFTKEDRFFIKSKLMKLRV